MVVVKLDGEMVFNSDWDRKGLILESKLDGESGMVLEIVVILFDRYMRMKVEESLLAIIRPSSICGSEYIRETKRKYKYKRFRQIVCTEMDGWKSY